ncbi:MAG: GNAT family N-acetyltransferase, partial [Proteobacteria bacterium]|nr:GNAT family N-acetyltransferase [Pseudomonadota bacterium]
MTIRHFESLLRPRSMALVGAGQRNRSVGQVVLANMLAAGFAGPIYPVNPKYQQLQGVACYPDIASLPQAPDLAVLCVGAEQVPGLVRELGARGTRAAVVITAGFGEVGTAEGKALEAGLLAAAKEHGVRLIGPNCVGLMVPGWGVNASFAHIAPAAGKLAFVSQSGALCTAILDDVAGRGIGFSHFVSLGNSADVDFGDMLDFLAGDAQTSAILLYIESVADVRKFISAGRAASSNKPVIVIKSGRNAAGAKAAASHTGALIGSDAVYDAAFLRAGMLRVYDMEELFDAVETLARITGKPGAYRQPEGPGRLTIVSNGGGPAVLATDYLVAGGGTLAGLSAPVLEKLNGVLPPTWSHGNPVDIIGDAGGERYRGALDTVMAAPETQAVLVMKCPTAVSDNMESAQAVIDVVKGVAAPAPLVL